MHDFDTCKENAAAQCQLLILNVFGRKIRRKLALRSGILFASTARSVEDETRNDRLSFLFSKCQSKS